MNCFKAFPDNAHACSDRADPPFSRRAFCTLVGAVLGAPLSGWAQDTFPSRPIRSVITFAAGGPADIIGRLLAKPVSEILGQPVIIDNRPGGDAIPATESVMKAAPDGYTVLQYTTSQAINMVLRDNVRYDLLRDFVPVVRLLRNNLVLMTGARGPYQSVADIIAAGKTKPGGLVFGSGGSGSVGHLSAELFKRSAAVQAMHVPYKGNAALIPDIVAGRLDYYFATQAEVMPLIQQGLLRALAVTSLERVATLPDVPSMAESGFPNFEANSTFGYFAPLGTPPPIVKTLQDAFLKALATRETQDRVLAMGMTSSPGTGEELAATIKAELALWGTIIKSANIRAG